MNEVIPQQPIQLDYEQAEYLITYGVLRKGLAQSQQRAKQAQAAVPAPHPSGLNRKQRRARRRS